MAVLNSCKILSINCCMQVHSSKFVHCRRPQRLVGQGLAQLLGCRKGRTGVHTRCCTHTHTTCACSCRANLISHFCVLGAGGCGCPMSVGVSPHACECHTHTHTLDFVVCVWGCRWRWESGVSACCRAHRCVDEPGGLSSMLSSSHAAQCTTSVACECTHPRWYTTGCHIGRSRRSEHSFWRVGRIPHGHTPMPA